MTEWQPIETAPKDGRSTILGCNYDRFGKQRVTLAWYDRGLWVEGMYWDEDAEEFLRAQVEFRPTHWMPLPTPPEQER